MIVRLTQSVGGDVGVFAHGQNAREIELMVAAGMSAAQVMEGGKVYAQ